MSTRKLTGLALLTASALVVFVLEAQLPALAPIPGIKLGLSNIFTICALILFGWREALSLLLVRVLLGSLLTAQVGALFYALGGGLLSLLAMCLICRLLKPKQLWIAGVLGAMLHNLGQFFVAVLLTATPSLIVYLPVLLLSGMITGLFTGLCAQFLCARLEHFKK